MKETLNNLNNHTSEKINSIGHTRMAMAWVRPFSHQYPLLKIIPILALISIRYYTIKPIPLSIWVCRFVGFIQVHRE